MRFVTPLFLGLGIVMLASFARAQNTPLPALAPSLAPQPALSCAIEWIDKAPEPAAVCDAIGRSLGRAVQRVPDARTVKKGDSVQVLDGDVFWIAVWLRNGQVRAFTRVSKTMAQGKELSVIARAVREISRTPAKVKQCVRVEPNGGRKMRSPDLAYPWVELKKCRTTFAEVPDPWVPLGK
jgi:hypothetical protein